MTTASKPNPHYKRTGNLKDTAKGRWREIFSILAPELENADVQFNTTQPHVPCPGHDSSDGFRLYKDVNETGGGVCNTCGYFADGFRMLAWIYTIRENDGTPRGYDPKDSSTAEFKHAYSDIAYYLEHGIAKNPELRNRVARVYKAETEEELALKAAKELENKKRIMAIGKQLFENSTSYHPLVEEYFKGRGAVDTVLSSLLRFNPQTPYFSPGLVQYMPSIIMPVSRVDDGKLKVVALHRIYLKHHDDGAVTKAPIKTPKMIMPWGDLKGAAIRLYPLEGSKTLVLAEGPETAVAIHSLTGLPVWSGVNAWGMEHVQIPEEVETVIIAQDFDVSEHGQKSAQVKAESVRKLGKTAVIVSPSVFYEPGNPAHKKGVDWDDAIKMDRTRASAMWAPFTIAMSPDEELGLPGTR